MELIGLVDHNLLDATSTHFPVSAPLIRSLHVFYSYQEVFFSFFYSMILLYYYNHLNLCGNVLFNRNTPDYKMMRTFMNSRDYEINCFWDVEFTVYCVFFK